MAVINSDNRDGWQAVANSYTEQYPSVGKTVTVVKGRKYKGQSGIIKRHIADRYADNRYKSDASMMLRQMKGREGYIVLIEKADGSTFWVKAEYVEINFN